MVENMSRGAFLTRLSSCGKRDCVLLVVAIEKQENVKCSERRGYLLEMAKKLAASSWCKHKESQDNERP